MLKSTKLISVPITDKDESFCNTSLSFESKARLMKTFIFCVLLEAHKLFIGNHEYVRGTMMLRLVARLVVHSNVICICGNCQYAKCRQV